MAEAEESESYFFLYPVGHLGFTAVTFLVSLPFVQSIVILLGLATGTEVCVSFTLIVGEEKLKL
jgi:hypothetical protein